MTASKRASHIQRWLGIVFIVAAFVVGSAAINQWPSFQALLANATPSVAAASPASTPTPSPTWPSVTREPLIPTSIYATPTPLLQIPPLRATLTLVLPTATSEAATAWATPGLTPATRAAQTPDETLRTMPTPQPTSPPAAPIGNALYTTRQRMCVGVPYNEVALNGLEQLKPGWYLNWKTQAVPMRPAGAEFAQMVRVSNDGPRPDLATLSDLARQNSGALWLIGNEMDVKWQDDLTPERYAAIYHDVYATLKQADASSRIAIGGVSQPTPLRLQYLDRLLAAYRSAYGEDLPVDVWNVHNFILQEKRGAWGVGIPPGLEADRGELYSIDDHDKLDIFKQHIYAFRQWMAQHGYRDKELIVTEYGILMPPDYGFEYEQVRAFMLGTFDFMRTASSELGLPADGNRLVQRWCWYSLSDNVYPTGNLLNFATNELTPLGQDYKAYMEEH